MNNAAIVRGYQADKIKIDAVNILYNPDYKIKNNAHSLMLARDRLKSKCVMVYSDILFDRQILERLLDSPHPITMVIDRAYQSLPFREKNLDLVVAEDSAKNGDGRNLQWNTFKPIARIGKRIDKQKANYEFIGMAFFREEGLKALIQAWDRAQLQSKGRPFHEAPSIDKADFTDLIQCLVDQGYPVFGLEIKQGWSELHSLEDVDIGFPVCKVLYVDVAKLDLQFLGQDFFFGQGLGNG